MELSVDFINDSMSINDQVEVWREEYIKLYRQSQNNQNEWQKREEKGLKLIKQYQEENDKMEKTNKLGIKLVENLRKQIQKYQSNDNFKMNNDENNDIDSWKSRYLTEKRTSEYLRAECEDLQNEIEEIKQNDYNNIDNNNNNNDGDDNNNLEKVLKIVNEAWEEEVTALIEQFKNKNNNNINNYDNLTHLKNEMKKEFNKKKQQILSNNNNNNNNNNDNNIDYKLLYDDLVKSKLKLIDETSQEIQNLRQIIWSQNTELYRNIFDRIVRYHNLDGGEDTLFQLMIDAELHNKQKKQKK